MSFADPVAAFGNVRRALAEGGRAEGGRAAFLVMAPLAESVVATILNGIAPR